jgi:hypothetical protein
VNLGGEKMFYLRKPSIEINLVDYKDALFSSLRNEEWVDKAYNNETTMMEWFDPTNSLSAKKAINEYKKTKDIASLIKAKNKLCFSEQAMEIIFNAGKAQTNKKLAEIIFKKTETYANNLKYLLYEFCENTGTHLTAQITPFPNDLDDTVKPISQFKIKLNDEKTIITSISEKGLDIIENDSKIKNITAYFEERCKCKTIKKRYLKADQISESQYKKVVRNLINLKEYEVPVNLCYLTSENCMYKILYRGNQSISDQEKEISLANTNLKVLSITKLK